MGGSTSNSRRFFKNIPNECTELRMGRTMVEVGGISNANCADYPKGADRRRWMMGCVSPKVRIVGRQ